MDGIVWVSLVVYQVKFTDAEQDYCIEEKYSSNLIDNNVCKTSATVFVPALFELNCYVYSILIDK